MSVTRSTLPAARAPLARSFDLWTMGLAFALLGGVLFGAF